MFAFLFKIRKKTQYFTNIDHIQLTKIRINTNYIRNVVFNAQKTQCAVNNELSQYTSYRILKSESVRMLSVV